MLKKDLKSGMVVRTNNIYYLVLIDTGMEASGYSDINWKNQEIEKGLIVQRGTSIPKEIVDYYMEQGYADRGIPLNSDTCREIAGVLKWYECQYQNFQGIAEKYIECLNMLQCHCKETLADMVMIEQLGTENFKEKRIVNTYRRISCIKIKNQIWQQAKRTLKYKKYELRIYEEKKICR